MVIKRAAIIASVAILLMVCLVPTTPSLADEPGIWTKTDGVNEITPALTEETATFADDEAGEFVHQIQSWGTFGSQSFSTAQEALNWTHANISNVTDQDNYGVAEAWANPEQTLNQGSGDSEDMAFLLASLLKWHTAEVNTGEGDLVYAKCGFLLPPDGGFHAWIFWWDASETEWHQLDPTIGAMNHILYPAVGTLWLNDEHVCGLLCGYYPGLLYPPPGYDFIRISESGIIDSEVEGRHNSYAWSMDVLPTPDANYLYVGCNRDFLSSLVGETDGFEGALPTPVPLEPPCYPLPGGPPVPDWRGRLFRCEGHDPDSWALAYISPTIFHPGIGCPVPRYTGYRAVRTFTDTESETALYVATTNLPAFPGHILKFGQDYVPGTEPEIVGEFPGVSSIRSLIVHDGRLYASSFGGSDLQIWESDNPALGNWTQVAQLSDFPLPGIPPGYPRDIGTMVGFNGCLYAFIGVINLPPGIHPALPDGVPGGFWAYKSANPGIGNWTETMSYGAGNYWNEGVSNAVVFGDHVYLGTAIAIVAHSGRLEALEGDPRFKTYLLCLLQNWKGGDVLRFDSCDNWEMVIGDPDKNTLFADRVGDHGAGFCNPCNVYIWWMDVYQDELYVGTFDSCVLLSVQHSDEVDEILSGIDLPECARLLMGADLWVTENGACWTPVTLNGFGNRYNYGVRSLAADGDLFVGTANPFYGAEVWWKAQLEAESTDEVGVGKDFFATGDDVYATGSAFRPNTHVNVYVVRDRAWSDGDPIPADIGDGMDTLTADGYGNLGPFVIWQAPLTPGKYDIVFDANRNGIYDVIGDFVDHSNHPGFVVLVPPPVGGEAYPVNKISLLAPWIALAVFLAGAGAFIVLRRKQAARRS